MSYPHILSRVTNSPLLLEPGYAQIFLGAMLNHMGIRIGSITDVSGQMHTMESVQAQAVAADGRESAPNRSYVVQDEVAILPVSGSLVNRLGSIQPYSGMTGYQGIIHRAAQAAADPDVKGILIDMDTPGGEVAGCFDTAQKLRALADDSGKPLWALGSDMYCSAGMAIASSASRRLVTQSAIVGSVGVLMAHTSYQGMLEASGVKIKLIHSGARKVDGNPYEDLPEDVYQSFMRETHALRTEFAQLVSDHLGMPLDRVMATEAATYRGAEAVEVGFADEVVNGHEAIQYFSNHLSSSGRIIVGGQMADNKPESQADGSLTKSVQASADVGEISAVQASGRQIERQRISAITGHADAKALPVLANHLAMETDFAADVASGVLVAAAQDVSRVEQAQGNQGVLVAGTGLDAAMAGQAVVVSSAQGDEQSQGNEGQSSQSQAAGIVASYKIATGR